MAVAWPLQELESSKQLETKTMIMDFFRHFCGQSIEFQM